MRKLNHRKSDATQPMQKKGLSELAVHRDRSHSPQSNNFGMDNKLFGNPADQDDKGVVSEDDAPDKEMGNGSLRDDDWNDNVIKFE